MRVLYRIAVTMTTYINSNDHSSSLRAVLDLAQCASYMTSNEVAEITAAVNKNLNWQDINFSGIENWLRVNEPTVPPTETALTQQPTTTTTTSMSSTEQGSNGSNSLFTSFTMIAGVCVLCKMFIVFM